MWLTLNTIRNLQEGKIFRVPPEPNIVHCVYYKDLCVQKYKHSSRMRTAVVAFTRGGGVYPTPWVYIPYFLRLLYPLGIVYPIPARLYPTHP